MIDIREFTMRILLMIDFYSNEKIKDLKITRIKLEKKNSMKQAII